MTEVAVFVGPSLTGEEASSLLPQATLLPPVRLGDVCAAVINGFEVIVIIDGFFEQVPTVWHKEILWALSRGCSVYGASSMGALRAAELAPFGMCGVGGIFERFHDGTYNDDDEVTIIHTDDDDLGYRALSVAMASIREALEEAAATGLCTDAEAEALIASAKAHHYSERSWPLVLRDAKEMGMDDERVARLRAHVKQSDAKARDARTVLGRVRDDIAAGTLPPAVPFEFEPTYNFEKLLTIIRSELAEKSVTERFGEESAKVRARTEPAHLPLFHYLVEREARRLGLRPPEDSSGSEAAVRVAAEAGTSPDVVADVMRLESFRARLEQRHHSELAMFTETAQVAANIGTDGQTLAERMRSKEGNRLDDGRVVR